MGCLLQIFEIHTKMSIFDKSDIGNMTSFVRKKSWHYHVKKQLYTNVNLILFK
jgi:hypothetical protein